MEEVVVLQPQEEGGIVLCEPKQELPQILLYCFSVQPFNFDLLPDDTDSHTFYSAGNLRRAHS